MLGLLLLLGMAQVTVTPNPAPGPVTAQGGAATIAALYLPDALIRETARRQVRAMLVRAFDADPNAVALERRYPGTRAIWIESGLAELDAVYARELPSLQGHMAVAVERALSLPERDAVAAFMRSEAGQALSGELYRNFNPEKASRTGMVTLASARSATDVQAVEDALTPAARADIGAFYATAAGRKWKQLTPELQQMAADDANKRNPERIARVESVASAAVERHIIKQRSGS